MGAWDIATALDPCEVTLIIEIALDAKTQGLSTKDILSIHKRDNPLRKIHNIVNPMSATAQNDMMAEAFETGKEVAAAGYELGEK